MEKSKRNANRGRILVAKVGLDGHDRGARVLAQMLRREGFEVVQLGVRHTPDQVADIAVSEEVDVVGISLLSGAHVALGAAVLKALAERGADKIPVALGGIIPRSDAEALAKIGIRKVFHPGDAAHAEKVIATMDDLVRQSRDMP